MVTGATLSAGPTQQERIASAQATIDAHVCGDDDDTRCRALRTKNRSGDLTQIYTLPPPKYAIALYGAGHCNFTTDEQLGVLTNLDRWVRSGDRPTSLDLQVAMRGPNRLPGTGFDPTFIPGPWPAEQEIP
jgi:hypothetical protein